MPPVSSRLPRSLLILPVLLALLALPLPAFADSTGGAEFGAASQVPAQTQDPTPSTDVNPGGIDPSQPLPTPAPTLTTPVPAPLSGDVARVLPSGLAVAPVGAPAVIQQIIAAGNRIAKKKYIWGGGHRRWEDRGYDCSGSVSYALHAAGLLDSPLVSGQLGRWGDAGPGRWVTIYANSGHVYMYVAGLRFDTSGQTQAGSRWQSARRSNKGFKVRHPVGL